MSDNFSHISIFLYYKRPNFKNLKKILLWGFDQGMGKSPACEVEKVSKIAGVAVTGRTGDKVQDSADDHGY